MLEVLFPQYQYPVSLMERGFQPDLKTGTVFRIKGYKSLVMKEMLDRLSVTLKEPGDKMHLLGTISVVLLIIAFMGASLYVLINSAA